MATARETALRPAGAGRREDRDGLPTARALLVKAGAVIVMLALTVCGVVVYAVSHIDAAAIEVETERAQLALAATAGAPDAARADLLASTYALSGARFGTPTERDAEEVALAVPDLPDRSLLWTPRRLGSELFFELAPTRIAASLAFMIGLLILLRRLYLVARELERRRREAQALARRDPLTGLGNRLAFDDGVAEALALGLGEAVLLYLDLDGFKQVNDTLGHGAGDDVLRLVARRLAGLAQDDDLVARLGGDEFAVLRSGAAAPDELAALARRIEAAVGEPMLLGMTPVRIAASIGIAVAPADGHSAMTLTRAADAALYRAKRDHSGFALASAA